MITSFVPRDQTSMDGAHQLCLSSWHPSAGVCRWRRVDCQKLAKRVNYGPNWTLSAHLRISILEPDVQGRSVCWREQNFLNECAERVVNAGRCLRWPWPAWRGATLDFPDKLSSPVVAEASLIRRWPSSSKRNPFRCRIFALRGHASFRARCDDRHRMESGKRGGDNLLATTGSDGSRPL